MRVNIELCEQIISNNSIMQKVKENSACSKFVPYTAHGHTPVALANSYRLLEPQHRLLRPLQALIPPVSGSLDLLPCLSLAGHFPAEQHQSPHTAGSSRQQRCPCPAVHVHSPEKLLHFLHGCPAARLNPSQETSATRTNTHKHGLHLNEVTWLVSQQVGVVNPSSTAVAA